MCRNITRLYNLDPESTEAEIRAAALQYVRKVSGMTRPSAANEASFEQAVDDIAAVTERLLRGLTTRADPRSREVEAERARVRGQKREARMRQQVLAELEETGQPG
jgi:hypothetical protein